MLKNNDERLAYIRDDNNWTEIVLSTYPHMKMKFLKDTPFVMILAKVQKLWYGDEPNFYELGTYKMTDNGLLETVYSYSVIQIIDYLRKEKI